MIKIIPIIALLWFCNPAQAQTFEAHSQKAQLIELFTSQGCSSCPSAERWLNSFTKHPTLWVDTFPMAWHVDYWDQLGWHDRFSNANANHRQYRYHHQGITSGVYTPQAVINNQEWRSLLASTKPAIPEKTSEQIAQLTITVNDTSFEAISDQPNTVLNIAILGMGYLVDVKRGENAGRELEEDFVVLGFQQYPQTDLAWQGSLPQTKDNLPSDAIVAWLSIPGENQAFGIAGGLLNKANAQVP